MNDLIAMECAHCNKTYFPPNRLVRKYCPDCKDRSITLKYNTERFYFETLSKPNIGALAELIVCADLLKKGFEVFRSVSPHSTIDIVAMKDNKFFDIDVKTGLRTRLGNISYKKNIRCKYTSVVIPHKDGTYEIIYHPELN